MYYIFLDNVEGTILGLSDVENLDVENNWFSLSKEAYDFILQNNGHYIVNVEAIQEKIEKYKKEVLKYRAKQIDSLEYIVVDLENLVRLQETLKQAIIKRISKNTGYCKMYIENGINYTFEDGSIKQFTYKIEDQINFMEIRRLFDDGTLTDNDVIPLKAKDESEYDLIKISTVIDIHNKLIKNKQYQLLYLRQLNAYTRTLTNINSVYTLHYETILPEEYQAIIEAQMETYNKLG